MAETSRPWAGVDVGDAGPYSDNDWDDIWERLFGSGGAPYNDRGVIRNWSAELEVTDGGANTADVANGSALVHGKWYNNSAIVNLAIPSSVGAWREDLVCLQSDWTAQTIRIYRHANPADGVAYPAPTQTDGDIWEIPLAAVRINAAGGIIGITDLRDYVSDLMQPKQLQIMPRVGTGAEISEVHRSGVALNMVAEYAGFEFMVPLDFLTLVSAEVRFLPEGTGTIDWTAEMRAGACGEDHETHSDSATADALAVTNRIVECLDIAAALDGIVAGDEVGIYFITDAFAAVVKIIVLLLDFRYA